MAWYDPRGWGDRPAAGPPQTQAKTEPSTEEIERNKPSARIEDVEWLRSTAAPVCLQAVIGLLIAGPLNPNEKVQVLDPVAIQIAIKLEKDPTLKTELMEFINGGLKHYKVTGVENRYHRTLTLRIAPLSDTSLLEKA
jgi:hypothetical protein